MNGRVRTQQVEGLVEATNANGIKIGGAWLNVSRFRQIDLPEPGAQVRLEIDSKGYIKELEVLGTLAVSGPDRGARIARLEVLKAAASFLGQMSQCREGVRSEHVLVLADKWLK